MMLALATLALSAVSVSAFDLAPRQASGASGADDSASLSDSLACITALESAFAALPTPPPALASYVETASVTNICSVTLPASLEPVISSYDSALGNWYSSYSADVTSALGACPSYSSVGTASLSDRVCSTIHYSSSGSGGAAATKASSSSSTTATASGSAQPISNVGNHQTGAVAAAAMAVVGVLAVVAAL